MGNLGNAIKSQVNAWLNDDNIRSTFILTPITKSVGANGGYSALTRTTGTARSVYCIPANNMKLKLALVNYGDLKTGEVRLFLSADEVVSKDDQITWQSDEYEIREMKKTTFNDVQVCLVLTLSKRVVV